MTLLDIFLLGPLLWFGFKGAKNGAVMEFVQLLAIVSGVFIACKFSHVLSQYLHLETEYAGIIYFAVTFMVVVSLLFLAGYIVDAFIKMMMLGWLNRLRGVVLALAKTILFLSVLIFYFNEIDRNQTLLPKSERDKSLLFHPLESIAPKIMPTLTKFWENPTNEDVSVNRENS